MTLELESLYCAVKGNKQHEHTMDEVHNDNVSSQNKTQVPV